MGEVERCILEPGGTLTFVGKKPDTEDKRHQELLSTMETLRQEVALLRNSAPPTTA